MISFAQFLTEMPYAHGPEGMAPVSRLDSTFHKRDPMIGAEFKKIGSFKSHNIMHVQHEDAHSFVLAKGKQRILQLQTINKNLDAPHEHTVKHVSSVENSPIKAHEFYHHLVTKHGITLNSDTSHTPGGRKVWERLHAMPGIKMTHHGHGGQEAPIDTKVWKNNYDSAQTDQSWKRHSYFKAVKA